MRRFTLSGSERIEPLIHIVNMMQGESCLQIRLMCNLVGQTTLPATRILRAIGRSAQLVVLVVASCRASAQTLTPVYPDKPLSPDTFYGVKLICPETNAGTLDFQMRNKSDWTARMRLTYSARQPTVVKLEFRHFRETEGRFQATVDTRVDAAMADETRSKVERIIAQSNELHKAGCLADKATQARYQKMLADNEALLGEPRQ